MGSLAGKIDVIRQAIADYAKPSLKGEPSYLTVSADGEMYSVIDVYKWDGQHRADAGLVVRIAGEYVVIDHDTNYPPLVDALLQVGIPRSQIILAYAGESYPKPPDSTSGSEGAS